MRGRFVTPARRIPRNLSLWRRIRGKWFARDLILVSLIALVVFFGLTQALWLLSTRDIGRRVLIEIPPGASVKRIAELLESEGITRDASKFVLAVRISRQSHNLQAGTYEFGPEVSELDVLLSLRYGEVAGRHVTIPEGYRASQIAALLEGKLGLDAAEFMRLVHDPDLMVELGISAPSLEGFLFPDTYRFHIDSTERAAIVRMVEAAKQVFDERRTALAESLGMSTLEILTLASIIEAEAMLDSERAHISAVYHNRLEHGWRLEADPTVRYAMGNYRRKLYYGDLDFDSPYNTYRRSGLPPGPICSPGLSSIDAALSPLVGSSDFFFVSNGDGTHTFSRTFEEHIRARNRAQRGASDGEFSLDSAEGG